LKAGGNSKVEIWLGFLLDAMQLAVKTFLIKAHKLFLQCMEEDKHFRRVQWVMRPDVQA